MEKLIKLLNEYTQNNYKELGIMEGCKWNDFEDKGGLFFVEMTKRDYTMEEETLISKKFGFIKWLVENDKIVDNNAFREYKAYGEGENYYFYLISELAVSDNPIQDLISLLK